MNKAREKKIAAIADKLEAAHDELTSVLEEERDWYDSHTSDSWFDSDAAGESEEIIDALDEAEFNLQEVIDALRP